MEEPTLHRRRHAVWVKEWSVCGPDGDGLRYTPDDVTGHWVCAYLDDIIGVASPAKASSAFTSLKDLLKSLGQPINPDKVSAPSTKMTCLGISINAKIGVLTIPQEKINQVKQLCRCWVSKT